MDKNWTFSDTLLGFAIYYLVFSLIDIFSSNFIENKTNIFFLASLVGGLTLAAVLYFHIYRSTGMNNKLDIDSKNIQTDILLGMSIGIILGFLGFLSVYMSKIGLFSLFSIEYLRQNFFPDSIFAKISFLLIFVLFIPITEEIYFRGFMYPALNKRLNLIVASLITAVFSSIFLSGTIAFTYLLLAGFIFGLLYEKTEAVFCSLVAHIVMNSIITLTIFIKGGS